MLPYFFMKIHRHFLYTLREELCHSLDPMSYSKFKYGCIASTRLFAFQMVKLVSRECCSADHFLLTSSAFLSVPNAAAIMTDEMLRVLPEEHFSPTTLKRDHIFPYDYAGLEQTQRKTSMEQVSLSFDADLIRDRALIVIDDCFVTGAHERNIINHLKGVPSQVHFFYLLDMSQYGSATIEDEINSAYVKELLDLLPIMSNENYQMNARTLKYILNSSFDDFSTFLSCIPPRYYATIREKAISEGYLMMSGYYQEKLAYVEHLVATSDELYAKKIA